jgi:CheY-like chemotaxis protein
MLHEVPLVASEGILIVEDNEVNALILRSMLRKHGYDPQVAINGAEGVEMTARHRPRLVLMDLHMPLLDGFAAAIEIRRDMIGSSPVLVAVTATSSGDVEEACRTAGFACILSKPILIAELLSTVRRFLT